MKVSVLLQLRATIVLVLKVTKEQTARKVRKLVYTICEKNCCTLVHYEFSNSEKSRAINLLISCFIDVNECTMQNGGCSHKCTNIKGSYTCSCPDPELKLAPDRHTCVGTCVGKQRNKIIINLKSNMSNPRFNSQRTYFL